MRPQIKDIALLALMIGAGILLQWQWSGLAERMDRLNTSQKEFTQRVKEAIASPEQGGYPNRIQGFLQLFKQDLVESQPGRVEWSDEPKEKLERQLKNGAIDEAKYDEKMQVLALAKTAYETLLDAQWNSLMTLPGKGDTRLDIYRIQQQRDAEGNLATKADFFLWGVPSDASVTWGRTETKYWQKHPTQPEANVPQPVNQESNGDRGAPTMLSKTDGSARPSVFVKDPTRLLRRFPGNVAIGTFQLPAIPEAATTMDLQLEYTVHQGDDEHVSRLNWKKIPVRDEWRRSAVKAEPAKAEAAKAAN